jgi:hypothetical protein
MVRLPPGYHYRAGGWPPGWIVPAGTQIARKVLPAHVPPVFYGHAVQTAIGPYGFAQATISAAGAAQVTIGPQAYQTRWELAQASIATTTGAADVATAELYAQPYGPPSAPWQVGQSYQAGGDQVGLAGVSLITGEVLIVVWSGGHPGDTATLVLSGTQTVLT